MRNPILVFVLAIALTSCISSARISEIKDSKKEIESIQLIQNVTGNLVDEAARPMGHLDGSISTIYLFETKKGEKSSLRLDIQIETLHQTSEPDSMAFVVLDGERIRIVPCVTDPDRLKSHQFIIPENLWVSIANTEKIQYQLFLAEEAIDVKLNDEQIKKLREFFIHAIQISNDNLPPTPEGLKKL